MSCGGRFHCPREGHTRIKPQALTLTLAKCRPTQPSAAWLQQVGVHTRTHGRLRVPWGRDPLAPAQRLRPLCVSPVPPQPAGRPPWRCRASSRGSLSREPFHSEGQSHTCPHQAHSPQARHGPVTWGRARTPSHGAQHSPRRPGVGPHPSVSPRGLNTGTRTDGWHPTPAGVRGGSGAGGRAVPVSLPGGVASTGVDGFTAVSREDRDEGHQSGPTDTSVCKPLWQARPLPLSHARPPSAGDGGPQALGICPQGKAAMVFASFSTSSQDNVWTYNVFRFLSPLKAPGWISLILLKRRSL